MRIAINGMGRIGRLLFRKMVAHPEIELVQEETAAAKSFLEPIYSTTEKLKVRSLGSRPIAKLVRSLLALLNEKELPENPLNQVSSSVPVSSFR